MVGHALQRAWRGAQGKIPRLAHRDAGADRCRRPHRTRSRRSLRSSHWRCRRFLPRTAAGLEETVNLEIYTRAQMARFAIEEGQRHGGIQNMLAVLHVLRNRVFRGWGNWQSVVDKAPEYRGT